MIWDINLNDMEMYGISAMYFVWDFEEIMYSLQVYLSLSLIISTFPGFEGHKRDARIEHLYVRHLRHNKRQLLFLLLL